MEEGWCMCVLRCVCGQVGGGGGGDRSFFTELYQDPHIFMDGQA